jgi:uncharacterized membrane-anchored protein YitT (DUF2179 family)
MKNSNYYYKAISLLVTGIAPLFIAIGINMFVAPNSLAFGGVSGLVIVIEALTGLPIYSTKLVITVAILMFGLFFKGKVFFFKSAIPSVLIPVYVYLTSQLQAYAPGILISTILGATFFSVGIALILAAGGSTCGPDTVGEVIEERRKIKALYTRIFIDCSVIITGAIIFGWEKALYSIAFLAILQALIEFLRKRLCKSIIFKPVAAAEKA